MKTALNIAMLILISVGIIMAIAQILFYLGSLMFYPLGLGLCILTILGGAELYQKSK